MLSLGGVKEEALEQATVRAGITIRTTEALTSFAFELGWVAFVPLKLTQVTVHLDTIDFMYNNEGLLSGLDRDWKMVRAGRGGLIER